MRLLHTHFYFVSLFKGSKLFFRVNVLEEACCTRQQTGSHKSCFSCKRWREIYQVSSSLSLSTYYFRKRRYANNNIRKYLQQKIPLLPLYEVTNCKRLSVFVVFYIYIYRNANFSNAGKGTEAYNVNTIYHFVFHLFFLNY